MLFTRSLQLVCLASKPRQLTTLQTFIVPTLLYFMNLCTLLHGYRLQAAARTHVPPYMIFPDSVVDEILMYKPMSLEKLRAIKGIGPLRLRNYGADIIRMVTLALCTSLPSCTGTTTTTTSSSNQLLSAKIVPSPATASTSTSTTITKLAPKTQVVLKHGKHGGSSRSKLSYTVVSAASATAATAAAAVPKPPAAKRKKAASSASASASSACKPKKVAKRKPTSASAVKAASTTTSSSTTPSTPTIIASSAKPTAKQRVAHAAQAPRRSVPTYTVSHSQQHVSHVGNAATAPDHAQVYILELQQNKVYVGKSVNVAHRLQQHQQGKGEGAAFTKLFKPTGRFLPRLGNVSGSGEAAERDETLRYMFLRGISNVRGWKYTQTHMDHKTIIDAEMEIRACLDLCWRCGQKGHMVKQCKAKIDRLGRKI